MIKTVSAIKARQNLGQILDEVRLRYDEYIIERNGKPVAVVVPIEEFRSWQDSRGKDFSLLDSIKSKSPFATEEEIEGVLKEAIEAAKS